MEPGPLVLVEKRRQGQRGSAKRFMIPFIINSTLVKDHGYNAKTVIAMES